MMKERFAKLFVTKTQEEWIRIFESSTFILFSHNYYSCVLFTVFLTELDACVDPVLELSEAPNHPHNRFATSCTVTDAIN